MKKILWAKVLEKRFNKVVNRLNNLTKHVHGKKIRVIQGLEINCAFNSIDRHLVKIERNLDNLNKQNFPFKFKV